MKYTLKFLRVQFQRIQRILAKLLAVSFVSCLCVTTVFVYFIQNSALLEGKKNYRVGIVGNTGDSYLGFGIQAVQTLDDSRFMVDFEEMDEDEARRQFIRGNLTGYVIIPDGLVDSFVYGRNDKTITYVVSSGQRGVTSILMEELAEIVSTLITHFQAAVFGMQRILLNHDRVEILDEATDRLNVRFISYVLNRTDLCEVEETGVSDGIDVLSYYTCSLFVLILTLMGMNYSVCLVGRDAVVTKVFDAKGLCVPVQVLCEYLAYVFMNCCALSVFLVLFGGLVGSGTWKLPEWGRDYIGDMFRFFLNYIPVIFLISAAQFLFYEFARDVVSGILLQFLMGMAMCYLAGCFYPSDLLPAGINLAGRFLPAGMGMHYLKAVVSDGSTDAKNLLVMVLYCAGLLAAACLVRTSKMGRGEKT